MPTVLPFLGANTVGAAHPVVPGFTTISAIIRFISAAAHCLVNDPTRLVVEFTALTPSVSRLTRCFEEFMRPEVSVPNALEHGGHVQDGRTVVSEVGGYLYGPAPVLSEGFLVSLFSFMLSHTVQTVVCRFAVYRIDRAVVVLV